MCADTEELVHLCERLPETKRAAVAAFARYLLAREQEDGDAAWERIIADPRPRPKLDEFVRAAMAEDSEPLDPDRL